ncbi:MAG: MupA/Atu3671 family FMN-dependent luciferase-like monooxygenase [Actinomycetota bacterium]
MIRRRCYVVGDDVLTVRCVEILRRAGWPVVAVITSSTLVADHATSQGTAVLDADAVIAGHIPLDPVDHVFSIANLRVLPSHVLGVATNGAINFHDGPLPERAGLHATSWAIAEGATEHAVTWHLMEAAVDSGPVLVREPVPVHPTDTAFTLNTACLDAGVRSFERLVEGLATDTITAVAQGRPPDVVHRRWHRPPAAGLVEWHRSTTEIVNQARALDFGPAHANPLGLPKIDLGHRTVVCTDLTPAPGHRYSPSSPTLPGTILHTADGESIVATADGAVRVGVELDLAVGHQLPVLDANDAAGVRTRHEAVARHEAFWEDALASAAPTSVPGLMSTSADPQGVAGTPQRRRLTNPDLLPALAPLVDRAGATGAAAAFVLFLARLTSERQLTVHMAVDVSAHPTGLFASSVPWTVDIDPTTAAVDHVMPLVAELDEVLAADTHLVDLWQRAPALRARPVATPELVIELASSAAPVPTTAPLTVVVTHDGGVELDIDEAAIERRTARRLLDQFAVFATALTATPSGADTVDHIPLLTEAERTQVLVEWNQTETPLDDVTLAQLLRAAATAFPATTAVIDSGTELTYADLHARADRVAGALRGQGVGPGQVVGIHLDRSADLVTAVVGTLMAGAAYLPLDPTYPAERVAFMVADSAAAVIISDHPGAADTLDLSDGKTVLLVDEILNVNADEDAARSAPRGSAEATPHDLAYLIYTSGSTGTPKGVMVEHRNVVSFCAAMDERVPHQPGDVWLAVTSLSFDISVLELLWTLTRGLTVVIQRSASPVPAISVGAADRASATGSPAFSLFYFSADEGEDPSERYRLLTEGARFADQNGFAAVWTPERHFHDFGGLYPNPAVAGAALAMVTEHVDIRAGSVVAPLHAAARIAEEWAVVDNLSNGRTGVAFASGWMPEDFVLRPEAFANNKAITFDHLDAVRRLWRGETVDMPGPNGEPVAVQTRPRPVRDELAAWITTAGNPATFEAAAHAGAGVLTHLLGQSIDELAAKIERYRAAWQPTRESPTGHVVVMVHTFIASDHDAARDEARGPLKEYLRTATDLFARHSASFPTFANRGAGAATVNFGDLSDGDIDAVLDHAADRYMETSGLIGDPESTRAMVEQLRAIGVDEVACLVDFGIPTDTVLNGLTSLDQLRRATTPATADATRGAGETVPELIARHGVTHLQCTPTLARLLLADQDTRASLGSLDVMLVGGEACPAELAAELVAAVDGPVLNMYGPTETTIWSTTQRLDGQPLDGPVPIGTPIPNTSCYVVNSACEPQPVGVPGELLIGGPGVTRGYHDRPDLTADRFVPDPFDRGTVYRTGDLVRWRHDGVLEFLGRADHQVKIRGHRIELGEIETVLDRHPAVDTAVVIAREDVPGHLRLVGYVVTNGAAPESAELRAHVAAHLPDYMVPAQVIALDAFPQTPNSKIDRKALPAPGASAPAIIHRAPTERRGGPDVDAWAAPQGSTEEKVAQVWSEVLAPDRPISRTSEFFALGGDSLALIQAVSRMSDVFGRRVSIAEFVRNPTVAATAALVDSGHDETSSLDRDRDPASGVTTRPMTAADLNPVLSIHMRHFPEWRISKLGVPYLREAYRWFMAAHPELAIVAERSGRLVGFTVGTVGPYKGRLLRSTWRAAIAGTLSNPASVLRPEEDDRPDPDDPRATDPVLANNRIMAVDDSRDGAGFALILAFEEAAAQLGTEAFFHDEGSH